MSMEQHERLYVENGAWVMKYKCQRCLRIFGPISCRLEDTLSPKGRSYCHSCCRSEDKLHRLVDAWREKHKLPDGGYSELRCKAFRARVYGHTLPDLHEYIRKVCLFRCRIKHGTQDTAKMMLAELRAIHLRYRRQARLAKKV